MTADEKSVRKPSLPIYPPRARSQEERSAAFEALLKLADHGWKSDGPYGPRDELYDR